MFEPVSELSSDLEWMLQSGQASPDMLAEALVLEYGEPVYQLALALLDDPVAARQALRDAVASGLENVYRYKSGRPVAPWWWGIVRETLLAHSTRLQVRRAVEAGLLSAAGVALPEPRDAAEADLWLAVDRLKPAERFLLIVNAILEWPPEKIAAELGADEREVGKQLARGNQKVWAGLRRDRSGLPVKAGLERWMVESLRSRWPALRLEESERLTLAAQAVRQAEQQGARRRGVSYLKELVLVGMAILFVAGLIYGFNRFFPEEPEDTPQRTTPQSTTLAQRSQANELSTSAAQPSATHIPQGVYYRVQQNDSLNLISTRLGVTVEELVRLNRLPPDVLLEAGQSLLIPGSLPVSNYPSPTPLPPATPLPTLGADASLGAFAERMSYARVETIWLDALLLNYGPPGYIGPAQVYHLQAWLGQNRILLAGATQADNPEEVLLFTDDVVYRARPAADQPWFFPEEKDILQVIFNRTGGETGHDLPTYMAQLFASLGPLHPGTAMDGLEIGGADRVAGRDTWIASRRGELGLLKERFWLDTGLGWALRHQTFDPSQEIVISEQVITGMALDVPFPPGLFDPRLPWRGGFARDASGEPALAKAGFPPGTPLGRKRLPYWWEPPAGFDPADSRLTFQFNLTFNPGDAFGQADLFGDRYYLGPVEFGNPLTVQCDRSADGQRIAYVSARPDSGSAVTNLRWFDLSEPERVQSVLPGISISQFAFSPDGRFLAASGGGGLHLVELASGQTGKLVSLLDANSLAWRPDGEELAFIARWNSPEEEVVVMQIETGAVIYRDPLDRMSGIDRDWPMIDWGVDFPTEMGGLEACTIPPGN